MSNKKKIIVKDEWYQIIPLALLVAIVPLIVYLKVIPLSGASYSFWNGEKSNMDFFSYYKMTWLLIFTAFAILMFVIKGYHKGFNFKRTWLYVPIGIYSIFVILSGLLSKYPSIAKYGFTDRYEGMFVLLAYMLILFLAINMLDNDLTIKVILGALLVSALVIGIIGIFQFIGKDFFQTSFGKGIILPAKYQSYAASLQFKFGANTIYSTLYHYDYVGSYMAMLAPLSLTIFILYKGKISKIILAFITLIMFFNLIGCNSRAGLVGVAISMIVLLFMLRKKVIKNWKLCILILISILIVTIGMDRILNGKIEKYVINQFQRGTITTVNDKYANRANLPLKDIVVNGNKAEVITKTETLKVEIKDKNLNFYDINDKSIIFKYDKTTGKIILNDDRYKDYAIIYGLMDNQPTLNINKDIDGIKLSFRDDNQINLISNTGRIIKFGPVEKWGFEGQERLASSRGYIWSRSIPLLKNTILLGHGADTFTMYFPQNDFKGKMVAYYGDMTQIVDKAHNLYLQNAINNGVISVIALIILFAGYIVMSIRTLFNSNFNDFKSIAALGILGAVIAYLATGFFNDSVVSVAPVFWVLLGIGISLNLSMSSHYKRN